MCTVEPYLMVTSLIWSSCYYIQSFLSRQNVYTSSNKNLVDAAIHLYGQQPHFEIPAFINLYNFSPVLRPPESVVIIVHFFTCVYINLFLNLFQLYDKIRRSEQKHRVSSNYAKSNSSFLIVIQMQSKLQSVSCLDAAKSMNQLFHTITN